MPNPQLSEPSRLTQHIDEGTHPDEGTHRCDQLQVAGTSFVVLFCIVGLALWGLPFYYDFR